MALFAETSHDARASLSLPPDLMFFRQKKPTSAPYGPTVDPQDILRQVNERAKTAGWRIDTAQPQEFQGQFTKCKILYRKLSPFFRQSARARRSHFAEAHAPRVGGGRMTTEIFENVFGKFRGQYTN